MDLQQAEKLLTKYLDGHCSKEEKSLIEQWYVHSLDLGNRPSPNEILSAQNTVWKSLQNHKSKRITLYYQIAVAALILTLLALGLIYRKAILSKKEVIQHESAYAIPPGGNNATLTLDNGVVVQLNKIANGFLLRQGPIEVSKIANGHISYKLIKDLNNIKTEERRTKPHINILNTPKGGQFQITLPDGTKVWLNAASNLTFPISFNGREERMVKLDGEAYFEVAKDKLHPFVVTSSTQEVKVLGTHFNVNTYPEESGTKTTLLEGSVQVTLSREINSPSLLRGSMVKQSIFLKPGQQSKVRNSTQIEVTHIDTQEAIAWKNGYFHFTNQPISVIMAKIARWYNVEINFQGNISDILINAVFANNRDLNQVLRMLEKTGEVHFKVKGRRVIVTK